MAHTILIVDDEPDLVTNCQRLLRPLGFRCLGVGTVGEAMGLIDREAPDLVVTDLRLPGADGLAVARHARAHVPPVPVILISADDVGGSRDAAREAGVGAFLLKPFPNAVFLETVRRVLTSRAAGG